MHDINQFLETMIERKASDLILKAYSPPFLRIWGDLQPMDTVGALAPQQVKELIYQMLTEEQRKAFEDTLELDFAYELKGKGRFRGNVFQQRGALSCAMRLIPSVIPTLEELGLPESCRYFCERPRGLVLVTGPAGSGKSTTQAAMIDYINSNIPCHIITIEDPIEFIHEDKCAIVDQRQLLRDTDSFSNALKYALRQDPDVILIGEMRDLETIRYAIISAETGHLVIGTLHTPDAVQTVDRVIDVFPVHEQQQIRMQLSVNLLGVIAQTLVKRADGQGRVAAFEVLVCTPAIRNLIRENKTFQIASIIQTGQRQGMMTLDQSLVELVRKRIVRYEDAAVKCKNPKEFEELARSIIIRRSP